MKGGGGNEEEGGEADGEEEGSGVDHVWYILDMPSETLSIEGCV